MDRLNQAATNAYGAWHTDQPNQQQYYQDVLTSLFSTISLFSKNNRGHPLAGRVSRANPFLAEQTTRPLKPDRLLRSNPFPHFWLRPSRARHPCGSSGRPVFWCRPGSFSAPEKRWCRHGVRRMVTEPWLMLGMSNLQLAHPAVDPVYNPIRGGVPASTQTCWFASSPQSWLAVTHRNLSQAKQRFTSKGCFSLRMW